jgi:hypothetical protein
MKKTEDDWINERNLSSYMPPQCFFFSFQVNFNYVVNFKGFFSSCDYLASIWWVHTTMHGILENTNVHFYKHLVFQNASQELCSRNISPNLKGFCNLVLLGFFVLNKDWSENFPHGCSERDNP